MRAAQQTARGFGLMATRPPPRAPVFRKTRVYDSLLGRLLYLLVADNRHAAVASSVKSRQTLGHTCQCFLLPVILLWGQPVTGGAVITKVS